LVFIHNFSEKQCFASSLLFLLHKYYSVSHRLQTKLCRCYVPNLLSMLETLGDCVQLDGRISCRQSKPTFPTFFLVYKDFMPRHVPHVFYHAAVVTGRITGLARPSVRPSVCPPVRPVQVSNSKTNACRKKKQKNGVTPVSKGWSNRLIV